mgnify:CR=1 FL=1
MKNDIRLLSLEELEKAVMELGESKFRAKQIFEWIWKKKCVDFDSMTNLSIELRDKLNATFLFNTMKVETSQRSSDGTFKFGNDTNNVNWNTDLLVPRLEISGDVYAKSGRIGSVSPTDPAAWTISSGLIRSGTGTSTVALASPALNFANTANQTINRYTITKLVINDEGDGLSTLYLHITVPNLETFLETQLTITINTAEELSSAIYDYFLTKPILFQSTDIFSTTLNPNFKTSTENRWLNVQNAGDYSVSLEFWGEDYGYSNTPINFAVDETITGWTTKQIDVLSGSSGTGNYVFWTGANQASEAPFSIYTDGSLYSQNISSDAINAEIASVTSFILGGHTVSISADEPESPVDGDIWIEIV